MLRNIFKQTKKDHGITGKAISRLTGVSENHISEFLNGNRDMTSQTLWRLVEAMDELSPGAKRDFGLRLAGLSQGLTTLVEQMPPEEVSDTLTAIAESLRKPRSVETSPEKEAIQVA
jgi:transcriptional regulator with XRE-family HTH domain